MDWRELAACKDYPTRWWFPSVGQWDKPETALALQICDRCKVSEECAEYATEMDAAGIWAGSSHRSRTGRR